MFENSSKMRKTFCFQKIVPNFKYFLIFQINDYIFQIDDNFSKHIRVLNFVGSFRKCSRLQEMFAFKTPVCIFEFCLGVL